jgi:nucleoside-diphosphate-sugar epimerase
MANQPLIIYGDGRQTRDFIHVAGLCQAISLALESDVSGEVFQIAPGMETSIFRLVEHLRANFPQKEIGVEFADARPGEIRRNYSSIEKAKCLINFVPAISLVEGLVETCRWFLAQDRRP